MNTNPTEWISLKSLAARKAEATATARADWQLGKPPRWTRKTWREAANPDAAREYVTAHHRVARGITTKA